MTFQGKGIRFFHGCEEQSATRKREAHELDELNLEERCAANYLL